MSARIATNPVSKYIVFVAIFADIFIAHWLKPIWKQFFMYLIHLLQSCMRNYDTSGFQKASTVWVNNFFTIFTICTFISPFYCLWVRGCLVCETRNPIGPKYASKSNTLAYPVSRHIEYPAWFTSCIPQMVAYTPICSPYSGLGYHKMDLVPWYLLP